jgi:hypothetical protein
MCVGGFVSRDVYNELDAVTNTALHISRRYAMSSTRRLLSCELMLASRVSITVGSMPLATHLPVEPAHS